MTSTVTVRATVLDVEVDPEFRDRIRRHIARVRVDEVVARTAPDFTVGEVLNLLLHSPSATFSDPDPVGSTFLITLTTPVTDPYAGLIEVSAEVAVEGSDPTRPRPPG